MVKNILVCDNCKREVSINPTFGGNLIHQWIEVSRGIDFCNNKIKSGKYNFCSESCLVEFLTKD